jgi:hypothetical protein
MDIPIELFLGGIGLGIALAIFGFIRNPQVPAMLVFGGMFVMFFAVATDNIIMNSFINGGEQDVYIYDVTSSTGQVTLNAIQSQTQAELPSSSSSQLFGKTFDCMRVWLGRAGTPPESTITFGVFDTSNNVIRLFGTQTVVSMTSSALTPYVHCLPEGTSHTLGVSHYVGVNYNAGDATNTLTMRVDGNNPFDSTVTYRSQYLASWSSSTGQDVTMQLWLRGAETDTILYEYEFTELPKVIFALIGVTMMLCGAITVVKFGE